MTRTIHYCFIILILAIGFIAGCYTDLLSGAPDQDQIERLDFKNHLARSCRYFDYSDGGNPENIALIKTPDELDNYIQFFLINKKNERDYHGIFLDNLRQAIIDNYKNDYIVITAMYTMSLYIYPVLKKKCKELIINDYLYNYFHDPNPDINKYFNKICNTLAQTVYELSYDYNAEAKFQTTIELIDFVLKERQDVLDETLIEKLQNRRKLAVNKKKGDPYSSYIHKKTVKKQKELEKIKREYTQKLINKTNHIELEKQKIDTMINQVFVVKRKGDFQGAVNLYNKILKLNPQGAQKYETCDLLNNPNVSKDAIENYKRAVRFYTNYSMIYFNRGYLYWQLKEFDKSISDYSKALEFQPKDGRTHRLRGVAYRSKRNFHKALDDINKSIELLPENAIGFYERGLTYKKMGLLDKAISDYSKTIELDPKNADAFNSRGNSYFEKGANKEAFADFNRAIDLNHDHDTAYNNLAYLYAARKNGPDYITFSTALKYAKKAVSLIKTWTILDTLAAVYARGGDYTSAIRTERKALALMDKDVNTSEKDRAFVNNMIEAYSNKKNYIQWEAEQ